jgi:hypothetical protein
VWEDHLLPLLRRKDAARLGATCQALRGIVREHFAGDLGHITLLELQAALTTFPRARHLMIAHSIRDDEEWEGSGRQPALLRWLHDGGRGRHLEVVRFVPQTARDFIHKALQQLALPSLKGLEVDLRNRVIRASLTEGFVGAMHELRVVLDRNNDAQLAALGLVRELPALTELEISAPGHPVTPVQWPPFIPPPLKALGITLSPVNCLPALPDMLAASGARLDRLEVHIGTSFEGCGDGLIHLAQALPCCSPALKALHLATWNGTGIRLQAEDYENKLTRLRLQWTDVLTGVSACRELQVLVLPRLTVEPLFPLGTAFQRLTHLEVTDGKGWDPPPAAVVGLWEVMASGGLPALAKLSVRLEGLWGGKDKVKDRVAPAFKAVAGTLVYLEVINSGNDVWLSDEAHVGFELGMAVGRLRRLKDLHLDLFRDGRAYRAIAEGLAMTDHLPMLWRVVVRLDLKANADQVISLLLPSVRVFGAVALENTQAALLIACALRQAGYKPTLLVDSSASYHESARTTLRAITACMIGFFKAYSLSHPWFRAIPACLSDSSYL